MNRYLAITPAKDEEKYLPFLIDSLVNQSVTPDRWIIIDDGSRDANARSIDQAAQRYPWIEPHHLAPRLRREDGILRRLRHQLHCVVGFFGRDVARL